MRRGCRRRGPSIPDALASVDAAAADVHRETEANYQAIIDNPAAFDYSLAKYCIVCLVTVLQRKLGVRYNPKWRELASGDPEAEGFGTNANDLFIHAIINGVGGTCRSLPILCLAVARRLWYPLKLVKAHRHLFCRWDDPEGKLAASRAVQHRSHRAGHAIPFRRRVQRTPYQVDDEDIAAGIFFKSLTPAEEAAELLAMRARCLRANGDDIAAAEIYGHVCRLAPHNRYFKQSYQRLRQSAAELAAMRSLHGAMLAAQAGTSPADRETGPRWITGTGGSPMLVQVLRPGHHPAPPPPGGALGTLYRKLWSFQIATSPRPTSRSADPARSCRPSG